MKDAKPIFQRAILLSDVMIVERILVRVLPALLQHGQTLTAETIEQAQHLPLPDALYQVIADVAEELTGGKPTDASGAAHV